MGFVADDGSEPFNVLISGTACQDFSSMNRSTMREAGDSQIVFQWWKHNLRASGYDAEFRENVMHRCCSARHSRICGMAWPVLIWHGSQAK